MTGRRATAALVLALGLAVALAATAAAPARQRGAPPAPRALRPAAVGAATATISWREPRSSGSAPRFDVRARPLGRRAWGRSRASRATRLTIRGLRPATAYLVEVRACRRASCSRWSAPLALRTSALTVPPPPGAGPAIGGCPVFPADNAWNQDISRAPVDPRSDAYVGSIGVGGHLHPDFGSDPSYGIPYRVVPSSQALVPIRFTDYPDESDPGPYPIPPDAPVEAGSDAHVLVLQQGSCTLYEMFAANYSHAADHHWSAGSGAVFHLRSNALRPEGWTSADAAGLPILPGLVRRDEVRAGLIAHAIRMTVVRTQRGYIHPATHFASSSTDPSLPPMGLRLRLKSSFDQSRFPHDARVILTAMKTYGLIVADNGSNWFFTGATDTSWDDAQLNTLKSVPGSAFEAVQSGPIHH